MTEYTPDFAAWLTEYTPDFAAWLTEARRLVREAKTTHLVYGGCVSRVSLGVPVFGTWNPHTLLIYLTCSYRMPDDVKLPPDVMQHIMYGLSWPLVMGKLFPSKETAVVTCLRCLTRGRDAA